MSGSSRRTGESSVERGEESAVVDGAFVPVVPLLRLTVAGDVDVNATVYFVTLGDCMSKCLAPIILQGDKTTFRRSRC